MANEQYSIALPFDEILWMVASTILRFRMVKI